MISPPPSSSEGRDFSPAILNNFEFPARPALYMGVAPFNGGQFQRAYRAVRTAAYTYVRGLEGPWLLYDNRKDPHQLQNLVGNPQFSILQRRMEKVLQQELKRIQDDFRPPQYYIDKFGYEIARHGSISYAPASRSQTPKLTSP